MLGEGDKAIERKYSRLAAQYDRRWSGYVAATVRETLRRLELRPGDRILDVGCGTGALLESVHDANPVPSSIGADLSLEMLLVARRRTAAACHLAVAEAEFLPFGAASFDVVVSSSSFHYWRRPEAGLLEIRRVLRPGGRVVITDWCDDFLACRLCDLGLRLFDRVHRRSYDTQECRGFLERGGYAIKRIERYKINWLWGLMTATALRPLD